MGSDQVYHKYVALVNWFVNKHKDSLSVLEKEDVIQEAWLAVVRGTRLYDSAKSSAKESTYVYRSLANQFCDLRRVASRCRSIKREDLSVVREKEGNDVSEKFKIFYVLLSDRARMLVSYICSDDERRILRIRTERDVDRYWREVLEFFGFDDSVKREIFEKFVFVYGVR